MYLDAFRRGPDEVRPKQGTAVGASQYQVREQEDGLPIIVAPDAVVHHGTVMIKLKDAHPAHAAMMTPRGPDHFAPIATTASRGGVVHHTAE